MQHLIVHYICLTLLTKFTASTIAFFGDGENSFLAQLDISRDGPGDASAMSRVVPLETLHVLFCANDLCDSPCGQYERDVEDLHGDMNVWLLD